MFFLVFFVFCENNYFSLQFSQKGSIVDVWQVSKYAPEIALNLELFLWSLLCQDYTHSKRVKFHLQH